MLKVNEVVENIKSHPNEIQNIISFIKNSKDIGRCFDFFHMCQCFDIDIKDGIREDFYKLFGITIVDLKKNMALKASTIKKLSQNGSSSFQEVLEKAGLAIYDKQGWSVLK